MQETVEAIYEDGVIKPLQKLRIKEHQKLTVTISRRSAKGKPENPAMALVLFQLNIPKLIKWAMITSTLFISPSKVAIDSTSSFSMRSIITILQGKSF